MASQIERRLTVLETQHRAQRGQRVFVGYEESGEYHETGQNGNGAPHLTLADIDALAGEGWACTAITIRYDDNWRDSLPELPDDFVTA